jgi:transposase
VAVLSPTGWWLAVAPIDLRCGMDRLLVAVRTTLDRDAFDGGAFVFRNRSGTRIKVLLVDATGVWLCVRRLHEGSFVWPRGDATSCELDAEQFSWLCTGVDWQRLRAQKSVARCV